MKKYKLYLPMIIVILIAFFGLNSFNKKDNDQECQGYLVKTNSDLRHVNGISNNIINPYQTCVKGLQPGPGRNRKFMEDSYRYLLDYYQGSQQTFSYYKHALNVETGK